MCKYHGKTVEAKRGAARRLEIAQSLWDGLPHPAYVFFELLEMRWELSADGSELTCVVPTAQLGALEDVRAGLGWVNHWSKVSSYLKYHEARIEKKKTVRQHEHRGEETT